MITFRPIDLATDYPTLLAWWKGHGAVQVDRSILPRGWLALTDGHPIAASFLYMDPGTVGVIEWTTTNPGCSFNRDLVEAVKGLYVHLESVARAAGCLVVFSFVKPNSSEERIMSKMGYATDKTDPGHRLYIKPTANVEKFLQSVEEANS